MPYRATSDIWWKNAVIYCLDVETFMDSNGDGADAAGQLPRGPRRHLHLLMPFYPSPNRDDGTTSPTSTGSIHG